MQTYDVLNDKEDLGIPEVHNFEISADTRYDELPKTAYKFMHEQGKDSYCR